MADRKSDLVCEKCGGDLVCRCGQTLPTHSWPCTHGGCLFECPICDGAASENGNKMSTNLINCVEMLGQADRDIDLEIWNTIYPEDANPIQPVASFTGSTDAAISLLKPTVQGDKDRVIECRFDFGRASFYATVNYDHHGRGKTPATALCSAALRARAVAFATAERSDGNG